MKTIICLILCSTFYFQSVSQSKKRSVLKYRSQMKMVVDFKNSNKETEYNESSLIIVDFASKTINVHPDQFVLDMVKLLPDVDEEKYSVVTISCVDNNQKKCNFSATYFKTGEIILRITFDDTDYVYFVKSN